MWFQAAISSPRLRGCYTPTPKDRFDGYQEAYRAYKNFSEGSPNISGEEQVTLNGMRQKIDEMIRDGEDKALIERKIENFFDYYDTITASPIPDE